MREELKNGLLTILSLLYMRTQTLRLAEMTSGGSSEQRIVNSCNAYNRRERERGRGRGREREGTREGGGSSLNDLFYHLSSQVFKTNQTYTTNYNYMLRQYCILFPITLYGRYSVLPSIPKACRPNKPSVQNSL